MVELNDQIITIDVKGLRDKSGFPADNIRYPGKKNHFIIFISFNKKFTDNLVPPDAFIVPSIDLFRKYEELQGRDMFYRSQSGRVLVSRTNLNKLEHIYKNKWDLITKYN